MSINENFSQMYPNTSEHGTSFHAKEADVNMAPQSSFP
jgi:hypothetical protein